MPRKKKEVPISERDKAMPASECYSLVENGWSPLEGEKNVFVKEYGSRSATLTYSRPFRLQVDSNSVDIVSLEEIENAVSRLL